MMTIYDLKPRFQNLLRPICRYLARQGVTANQITLLALCLSLICAASVLMLGRVAPVCFLLLPITLFLRMALNAIDGMLAREHNMKSKLGAVLNELCDVISDSALYLTFLPCCTSSLLLLVIFLAVLSEYTGVLGVMTSGVRAYDGPMGKSDRAFLFGVIAIFIAFSLIRKNIFDIALVIIGILLVLTCINRAKSAIRQ